jgi:hypothetical protein
MFPPQIRHRFKMTIFKGKTVNGLCNQFNLSDYPKNSAFRAVLLSLTLPWRSATVQHIIAETVEI